jgi:hypothetical protein
MVGRPGLSLALFSLLIFGDLSSLDSSVLTVVVSLLYTVECSVLAYCSCSGLSGSSDLS